MTENSNSRNLRTYHYLFELCEILKFRQKNFYWHKLIFVLVFLFRLRPHPAKKFLVPHLKNFQKSHFQAIYGSKLDTVAQTISKNPVENFCPGTQLYFDEIFQKGQRHFKGTGYGCVARSSQKDRLPTYCLRPQLQTAAQDCSCLGCFF